MKLNYILLALTLVLGNGFTAKAADTAPADKMDAKKKAAILELFKLQKTDQIGNQVLEQMIQGASAQAPEDKKKMIADTFHKEARVDDLTESLIPVYHKNFTQEELNDIITFYKSKTGQKFISIQPQLIGESSDAIQSWASKTGSKVKSKLEKKKK